MLGMSPTDPDIFDSFIASNAPDAPSREEEIATIGLQAVQEKGKTIFPKTSEGDPHLWDYQIKGFFKDAAGMLRKVPGKVSAGIKAYKKEIDGLVFIEERKIPIVFEGEIGSCQRPLRAQTAQGERVSLANSETIPAGATIDFTITCLNPKLEDAVREWLDYGKLRGLGQWRNSGKGRFVWEEISR
jgi:hypothetical protein